MKVSPPTLYFGSHHRDARGGGIVIRRRASVRFPLVTILHGRAPLPAIRVRFVGSLIRGSVTFGGVAAPATVASGWTGRRLSPRLLIDPGVDVPVSKQRDTLVTVVISAGQSPTLRPGSLCGSMKNRIHCNVKPDTPKNNQRALTCDATSAPRLHFVEHIWG